MKLKQATFTPSGSWLARLVEIVRIAVENRSYRADEAREANMWQQFVDLEIR